MNKDRTCSKWGENSLGNQLPGVPRGTISKLETYVSVLGIWNAKINLTGAKSPQELIPHLIDCIQAKRILPESKSWLDLGSGNGMPGIVWALMDPKGKFFLVEANQKKAAFLHRVISQLNLKNVRVLGLPFHEIKPEMLVGVKKVLGVSRGTSPPQGLLRLLRNAPIAWKSWFVFSSPLTQKEYLTWGGKFGMKISSLSYPKGLEAPVDSGILIKIEPTKGSK